MCRYFELLFIKTKTFLVMCTRHGKKRYIFFGALRTAETLLLPVSFQILMTVSFRNLALRCRCMLLGWSHFAVLIIALLLFVVLTHFWNYKI